MDASEIKALRPAAAIPKVSGQAFEYNLLGVLLKKFIESII